MNTWRTSIVHGLSRAHSHSIVQDSHEVPKRFRRALDQRELRLGLELGWDWARNGLGTGLGMELGLG